MSELPKGWSNTDLSSLIVRIMGGGTPSKSNVVFFQGKIPFMTVKDMKERFPLDTIDHITEEAVENSSTIVVPADTLIVATRMSLGKIVRPRFETAINQDLKALFFAEGIDKTFIEHWWRSRSKLIQNLGTGTTVKGIRLEDIHSLSIDIPPLNEQKRIADKLDRLLAKVDNCRERLDRIPLLLKRFRQSVLAAAISGELTANWRDEQMSEPNEWSYSTAKDLCEWITKGTTPSKDRMYEISGDVPFIKVYNLCFDGRLDFTVNPTFIDKDTHKIILKRSIVFPSDVLMNIVGPPLGKVSIVPASHPEWNINQAIAVFRVKDKLNNKFLSYVLMSQKTISDVIQKAKATAGQFNLTLEICREIIVPVPSIKEQKEIVRRVEKLFDFADRLEARYQTARAQIDKLTPALLDKAFKGELVPQDPIDEPAAALLAKIHSKGTLNTKPTSSDRSAKKAKT
jgi:type I restriction enzyme, S subunit